MQEKLSQEEISLLNTEFDEETEKLAAERAQAITNAYEYGFDKFACDVADEMDKLAEEDEKDEEEEEEEEKKMDEESEKAAAELGAFIERGFFDGLRKLGSERHDNELYYLAPYIAEKIAAGKSKAVTGFVDKIRSMGSQATGKVKEYAKEVAPSKIKSEGSKAYRKSKAAVTGQAATGKQLTAKQRRRAAIDAAKGFGMTAARATPYAAGIGGTGYVGYKALGGGKKNQE